MADNPLEQLRELAEQMCSTSFLSAQHAADICGQWSDELLQILDNPDWVCVPREPTMKMLEAAQAINGKKQLLRFSLLRERWVAMIAAGEKA